MVSANAAGRAGGVSVLALLVITWSCAAPPESGSEDALPVASTEVLRGRPLDFVHHNGRLGELYMPEVMGGGGALLDVDSDGALDLYLVQSGSLDGDAPATSDRLLLNRSDGKTLQFVDATADAGLAPRDSTSYGMGAATGDVDQDGDLDLYVTALGRNRLLLNNGDRSFTDVTDQAGVQDVRWSVAATFVDFDADGWLDLMIGNYVEWTHATHRRCRASNGAEDYCGPDAFPAAPNRVLRNLGENPPRFQDVTAEWGFTEPPGATLGLIATDLDATGRPAVYVANDQSANRLWASGPRDTWEDLALLAGCAVNGEGRAEASMGLAAEDFDDDGDTDLLITHLRGETHTLYTNQATDGRPATYVDGSMRSGAGPASRPYTGFGVVAVDLERDGDLDLFVANGAVRLQMELAGENNSYPLQQTDQLMRNQDGVFSDFSDRARALFAAQVGRGVAAGDLDNDGDTDLVVINNRGPAHLIENRSRGPWIGLELRDPSRGGGHAMGARVSLEVDSRRRWRRVHTDGSYASAGDPRVLFGLAGSDAPVDVEVVWPDGRVEGWSGLTVNRYHELQRGAGSTDAP